MQEHRRLQSAALAARAELASNVVPAAHLVKIILPPEFVAFVRQRIPGWPPSLDAYKKAVRRGVKLRAARLRILDVAGVDHATFDQLTAKLFSHGYSVRVVRQKNHHTLGSLAREFLAQSSVESAHDAKGGAE